MDGDNPLDLISTEDLVREIGKRSTAMVCAFIRDGEPKDDGHAGRIFYKMINDVPFDATCETSIDLCIFAINKIRSDREQVRSAQT